MTRFVELMPGKWVDPACVTGTVDDRQDNDGHILGQVTIFTAAYNYYIPADSGCCDVALRAIGIEPEKKFDG
ncbi:hypothetical protein [Hoeflea poritis]|uniref:Uncharacterized protein n=1 Tax=Hoeflea poritis TaxID=2993659 RepID=A0ABT4VMV3_9HYPH|nr:hypothetical protein [Hoeflea poritis]MDA4845934.1 hypothetical protein [Hoeflea poritis]